MRSRKQGRWMTPFRLLMVAGLGILGTASWKYEWIPLHLGSAPTGALRDSSQDSAAAGQNQAAPQYAISNAIRFDSGRFEITGLRSGRLGFGLGVN